MLMNIEDDAVSGGDGQKENDENGNILVPQYERLSFLCNSLLLVAKENTRHWLHVESLMFNE